MRALILLAALPLSAAIADEVTLNDGRVLEGEIVSEDDKGLKFKMEKGTLTIDRADVKSVARKPTRAQEYKNRLAGLDPENLQSLLDLAAFASSLGLEREAVTHYLAAWRVDPLSETAKAELEKRDWHYEHGQWVSPDDYWGARGYRKLDDKWYEPQEYDWRLAQKEVRRLESLRSNAMEEMRRAEAKASAVEARVLAEHEKLVKLQQDSAQLELDLEAADNEVRRGKEEVTMALQNDVFRGAGGSPEAREEAERKLSQAKAALVAAEREAASCRKSLSASKRAVRTAEAYVEKLKRERHEAQVKAGAMAEDARVAGEDLERARAAAEKAKKDWEKSK
jgi:hypothetical protein